jgi:hypothetical protein
MEFCCNEMEYFVKDLDRCETIIGEGEISGHVDFDYNNRTLSINDGLNMASIDLNFCPSCGKKL